MKVELSQENIKDLKYQCRTGYIISILYFFLSKIIIASFYETNYNTESKDFDIITIVFIATLNLIISMFIAYIINRKYLADIKIKEAIIQYKIIQKKESKVDYEAGSGTLGNAFSEHKMNAFDSYSIIVENTRYRVDEELYLNCAESEKVKFIYAFFSKYLLSIELIKTNTNP